jgi:hypothetical protein
VDDVHRGETAAEGGVTGLVRSVGAPNPLTLSPPSRILDSHRGFRLSFDPRTPFFDRLAQPPPVVEPPSLAIRIRSGKALDGAPAQLSSPALRTWRLGHR